MSSCMVRMPDVISSLELPKQDEPVVSAAKSRMQTKRQHRTHYSVTPASAHSCLSVFSPSSAMTTISSSSCARFTDCLCHFSACFEGTDLLASAVLRMSSLTIGSDAPCHRPT